MTQLLIRLFVKDSENTQATPVRTAYGQLAGAVGILCNVLLFAGKFAVGTVFGSIAITADAMNNLSDASSNVVSLLGFRLGAMQPDEKHPYGHGRFEYLASLAVSVMILSIGLDLLKESVVKIMHPEQVAFSWLAVGVLLASILVKLWLSLFNKKIGTLIHSDTLMATAADSRNDVLSTLGVLIGTFLVRWTQMPVLDGVMGLAVAAFILWSGVHLVMETLSPLLGEKPDPEMVKHIQEKVMTYPNVMGTHDLMVHDYGPGHQFASLHVEFPAEMSVLDAHDLMDTIERDFAKQDKIMVTIHYDPIVTSDPRVKQIRSYLTETLEKIDPCLSLHDLRIVPGHTHTNIVFDLVTPAGYTGDKAAVIEQLRTAARTLDSSYMCVIKLEQAYVD